MMILPGRPAINDSGQICRPLGLRCFFGAAFSSDQQKDRILLRRKLSDAARRRIKWQTAAGQSRRAVEACGRRRQNASIRLYD